MGLFSIEKANGIKYLYASVDKHPEESQNMTHVMARDNLPESLVVKIWQHQLLDRNDLATEDGEPIKIIYPGRINDDRGADLLDAVIDTGRGLVKGDIEVHVKSSSWRAHGHHEDPNYNRVILHVAFWHDTGIVTSLQNGGRVSTLALHRYVNSPTDLCPCPKSNLSMPCRNAALRLDTGFTGELLDSAGEERFLEKAGRFQADLARTEASQSLYQGIMGALGYAKNKIPFLELARRLPLQILESVIKAKTTDAECLVHQQALLLGTAGLLPSQSRNLCQENEEGGWVEKLEKAWASSCRTGAMSEGDWHLFKVRPSNLPTRRIVAMSYLTLRYREQGIFEGLVNKLREAPENTGHHLLERALLVTGDGCWASHFDFGLPSRLRIPTLLGSRRAADIVVNVLLPFGFAWGMYNSQPGLASKTRDLYTSYPRLAVNTVERHMRNQLGLSSDFIGSAQRQQVLIHIYKTMCSQGKCHLCPLGG